MDHKPWFNDGRGDKCLRKEKIMPTFEVRKIAYGGVNLALITWLAFLAAGIFYDCVTRVYQGIPTPDIKTETLTHEYSQQPDRRPLTYYRDIISRDLFRTRPAQAEKKEISPQYDTENLETAELDARLWGTVSGNDSARYAVIETKDGTNQRQQNLFREGDTIDQAVIKRILRDKVVVSLNGQRQLLLLEDFKSQARRRLPPRRPAAGNAVYRRAIRRSTIDKAVSNVGQLMTQARIIPRNDGLAISAIKPGSLFRRLGLRNGDVIEGVNGRSIQSVDDALSIYNKFRNDSSVTVAIKRRGRRRTFQYNIR